MTNHRFTLTPRGNLEQFILPRVAFEPNTGCWLWTGTLCSAGYAIVKLPVGKREGRKRVSLARYMYQALVGSIQSGQVIGFTCGARFCVNPEHLYLRTTAEKLRNSTAWRYKSRQTHCRQGHAYTSENTEITNTGSRRCRTCHRATNKKSLAKQRHIQDELLPEYEQSHALARPLGRYYVYHLIDPASGEVFYVGKGSGSRAGQHRKDALKKAMVNLDKERRIRSILAQGLEVRVAIVRNFLSEEGAFLLERSEILRIGLESLTNKASGIVPATSRDGLSK